MSDKKYAHIDINRNRTITVGKSNLFCKFNLILYKINNIKYKLLSKENIIINNIQY